MEAVFAHDHRFYLINSDYYSDGGFNDETWEWYTKVFDKINVIARVIRSKDKGNLHKIKTPQVKIHGTEQIKYYDHYMEKLISNSDVVIARLHSFIGNRAIRIAKKHNKPYVIELVACPFEAYWYHGIIGKLVAPYMELYTKRLVKEAPYVVYVTEKYLQKRYPTNGKNTNCSNVSLINFDDSVLEKRFEHIAQADKKLIVGTAAAVNVRFKGQQYIIEALSRLKQEGITYEYQLVGGGDQNYLKSVAEKYGVSEQIKFLGVIPHDKVFDWLDTIDIYVQPSRQEGLPRALIEAMSRGLPAFGARTAGIPELLEDKYIFSNTKRNIDEICAILKNFNSQNMKEQAERNYIESKKYDKNIIEARRQMFLERIVKKMEL